jgi:DNA primase
MMKQQERALVKSDLISEIKSQLSIKELIQKLGLEMNSNGFVHSIYKQERTPSMKIYEGTNSFFCFASNQGGDILKLYVDYYRIDLKQAIKELAELLNKPEREFKRPSRAKMYQSSPPLEKFALIESEKEFFEERVAIIEYEGGFDRKTAEALAVNEIIEDRKRIRASIYEGLFRFNIGSGIDIEALDYLTGKDRNIDLETLERHRIFSINSVSKSIDFLHSNFSKDELNLSGLFSRKEYFIFSFHRIIIPYLEAGRITYLRGRYFDSEGNSIPQHNFSKYIGLTNYFAGLSSKRLYNIDMLRTLPAGSDLVICEGEFDSLIINSKTNLPAIAIPGTTNFPKDKVQLLSNYNLFLAFDSDQAGELAVQNIAALFDKPIKQIKLKNYKDISELFTNGTN